MSQSVGFDKYETRGAYHHAMYFGPDKQQWYIELVDAVVNFCWGSTLDIACGDGVVAKLITDRGYQVTGIDNEPSAIKLAKELVPNAKFLVKDISEPLRGHWDYLACLNTIEHLKQPESLLEVLERNIDKGGIVITDNASHPHVPSKYHVKEYTLGELLRFFHDYHPQGFELCDGQFIGVKVSIL